MLLSIVTGTYNRLPYLQSMVQSVRAQLPAGLEYEFVAVDGGSTDGTLEWCGAQSDIRLIPHGKLLGAIKAFCDGARAASGRYVILANDDVVFEDRGILRAIRHMEETLTCGAVAFADDRPATGYEPGYKVQVMSALKADGQTPVSVPYAQVGMFRRWLGDRAGWWGDKDIIMRGNRTYGGDNYLSARIWAMGYTVDAIEGVRVHDAVAPDELRKKNTDDEARVGSLFHQRFPRGVVINSETHLVQDVQPNDPALRILMATLYEPGFGHYKSGLREAFARVGLTVEIDYLQDPQALIDVAAAWKPHLIWTQMIDPALMSQVRAASPASVITNWYGDVYEAQLLSDAMLEQARFIDLQLVVNAGVLDEYASRGLNAAYWQIGYEPVDLNALPDVPAHDVLFQGNNYSNQRMMLSKTLRSLPYKVGVYGRGWHDADGETLYQFARSAALCSRAAIVIGDNQWTDRAFVSNRLFETLAAGGFLLHQHVPGLEELTGLRAGEHYAEWVSLKDLPKEITFWMSHPDERRRIAAAGQTVVREQHSFDVRVRELFALIERLAHEPA